MGKAVGAKIGRDEGAGSGRDEGAGSGIGEGDAAANDKHKKPATVFNEVDTIFVGKLKWFEGN